MSKQHLRLVVCDCPDCARPRLDMRRALLVAASVMVPVYGLLWAAWTILPA